MREVTFERSLGKERSRTDAGRGTDLVYEVLAVIVAELLGTNDAVKIGLHKFLDEVDLLEVIERGRAENVEYGDDVLVVEVAEELDLAEGAETEHGVVEGGDALDGHFAL